MPPTQAERVQAALDTWLAERAQAEGVTGIAAYVSLATPGPNIEAFAGRTGHGADDPPVDQNSLFAMGSTSKSFAAAVILLLEAKGLLYDRRHGRQMAAAVSGLGRRQHPAPARHDERHPQLLRDRVHLEGLGRRAEAKPDR